jgi:tight adherence protein C
MVLILLLGLLLIGAAAALVIRAFVMLRIPAGETAAMIDRYSFTANASAETAPTTPDRPRPSLALRRRLDAAATALGNFISERLPDTSYEEARSRLVAAGYYTTTAAQFIGYRILATVLLPAFWLLVTVRHASAMLVVAGMALMLLGGWLLPMRILRRRAQRRIHEIDYTMPDLIDLLVTTVEAGIALNSSLQIAARRFHGQLGAELRLLLQEQSMGLTLNEALGHMQERCDTPAIRSFVRSIIQGDLLGVSINQTLRNLATDMRKRRRQAAEERAQKAPVKMLFPLVLLILPALFLVLLGPIALSSGGLFGR